MRHALKERTEKSWGSASGAMRKFGDSEPQAFKSLFVLL